LLLPCLVVDVLLLAGVLFLELSVLSVRTVGEVLGVDAVLLVVVVLLGDVLLFSVGGVVLELLFVLSVRTVGGVLGVDVVLLLSEPTELPAEREDVVASVERVVLVDGVEEVCRVLVVASDERVEAVLLTDVLPVLTEFS